VTEAVTLIRSLTSDLTPEVVQGLIDKNISLWWDCTTPEIRHEIKQSLDGDTRLLFIPDDRIVAYIHKARPDLEPILSTQRGDSWLRSLIRTLRVELSS
jgi:hypothetical protein